MALFFSRSTPRSRQAAARTVPNTQPWSIRSSLALLVGACVLPGALMSTYFIVTQYQQHRAEVMRNAVHAAQRLAAALDRDLSGIESGLQVLATSPYLRANELEAFAQQASDAVPFQNISNYVLISPDGRQQVNTLKPWGSALPLVGGPAQLQRIFTDKTTVLTDLFIGPVTGKPILAMGVPVLQDRQVMYSLNAGIFPDRISALLQTQHFPGNWIAAVVDSQGKLVARSHEAARFVGKSAVPELVSMLRQTREGTLETVTLEGIPVITAFSHSSVSNWSVAVGIPRADLTGEFQHSLILMIAANIVVLTSALWVAWQLAMSRLVTPIDQLLNRMRRISHDEAADAPVKPGGSLEVLALHEGLADMQARLQQRDRDRQAVIQRLSTTLECISDGFYTLDHNWRFTYVNSHAEQLLKRDRLSLIGQSHWSVLDQPQAYSLKAAYERAVRTREATRIDIHLPDQKQWLEFSAYPSEHGLTVYFRDITAQRQAQTAQAAQLAAEAANKAKSEFLSRVSHELRTPLNAVLGFAQVLQMEREHPLNPRQRNMVDLIESAGQHLLAMISDVLDLSRVETGSLALRIDEVDIAGVVTDCRHMIEPMALAADVTLVVTADPAIGSIQSDKTRLMQVLLNLLSNGVKYNRPQGHLALTVARDNEGVRFTVQDTGLGMTASQLAHLFEPFNRLGQEKTLTAGTGIGLVISHKLVALMGGSLVCHSEPGQGSTFSFVLKG